MFHGTSSCFLEKIISDGLLANPPQKNWHGFYETLEGVYFACGLSHAYFFAKKCSSANNGNPLIVIADIDPSCAIADEDNIIKLARWSLDFCNDKYELELFKYNFFKLISEIEGILIEDNLKIRIDPILNLIFKYEIIRRQNGYYKNLINQCDKLSHILKSKILSSKKSIYEKSFRIIDDIKINQNKNSIISIVEFLKDNSIKIVYGEDKIPNTFFFQLRKMIGNFIV